MTTPGALIECPNCKKESVRRATQEEVLSLSEFLSDHGLGFGKDESEAYMLFCPACGWFDNLHNGWGDWYDQATKDSLVRQEYFKEEEMKIALPYHGNKRILTKFAFLPIGCGREVVWLEWVTIEQEYNQYVGWLLSGSWITLRFITE